MMANSYTGVVTQATTEPRASGTIRKRRAILDGGLLVFARDGYARASIDAIATAADVSTRTLYNHFGTKTDLFRSVIEDSATAVANIHVRVIQDSLGQVAGPDDLEPALFACGMGLLKSVGEDAPHWSLVRHVHADGALLPAEIIDSWQRLGPRRVQHELASQFARLDRAGLLQVDEPDLTAEHFSALTGTAHPEPCPTYTLEQQVHWKMTAAVLAFLRGALPR